MCPGVLGLGAFPPAMSLKQRMEPRGCSGGSQADQEKQKYLGNCDPMF